MQLKKNVLLFCEFPWPFEVFFKLSLLILYRKNSENSSSIKFTLRKTKTFWRRNESRLFTSNQHYKIIGACGIKINRPWMRQRLPPPPAVEDVPVTYNKKNFVFTSFWTRSSGAVSRRTRPQYNIIRFIPIEFAFFILFNVCSPLRWFPRCNNYYRYTYVRSNIFSIGACCCRTRQPIK